MRQTRYTREEVVRRGKALYEQQIRARVEGEHAGKFLAVDVETGDYEIDTDELTALRRAKRRNPEAALYLLRIGHRTAYRLGGPFRVRPAC